MIENELELLRKSIDELIQEMKLFNQNFNVENAPKPSVDSEVDLTYKPKTGNAKVGNTKKGKSGNTKKEKIKASEITHDKCRKLARICVTKGISREEIKNKMIDLGAEKIAYLEDAQLVEFYNWLDKNAG